MDKILKIVFLDAQTLNRNGHSMKKVKNIWIFETAILHKEWKE